jgi:hypothetical protein
MMGDLVEDGRGDPFRDPAAVAEQHPNRGTGRVREAAGDPRGQHVGKRRVERQTAALGELQHDDGHERLHDAAGAEAIGWADRGGRRDPTETYDAGPGAERGAIYVKNRSREVCARIAVGAALHLLELTGADGVEATVMSSRHRPGVSRAAHRLCAEPDDC